jgi:hypothetical protein
MAYELTYPVAGESQIVPELLAIAHNSSPWVKYFNFDAKQVPQDILDQDPFLYWLSERYAYKAGVLKMDPFTQYDWHIDDNRGVGVNLLLSNPRTSVCMYTNNKDALVKSVYPIGYIEGKYTVFNTQEPHSVTNFGDTRYLFSIEFGRKVGDLDYKSLRHDIIMNYEGFEHE